MAHHEISRGQIRGLLLLMVIGPLIPTVILLRYMTDSVRAERAENREQIAQIYQQSLAMATASLGNQWKIAAPSPGAAPARVVEYLRSALDPRATVVVRDENGARVLPRTLPPAGEPVATSVLPGPLRGWTVQLFIVDRRALNIGNADATVIVVWTVSAALAANLLIAGLAAFAVFRQMKIHELRNSTLAMVTHEFKTPLASMRVLLDTLREGRYRGPQQLAEYLELLGRENGRLSGVVENFLTLSRIERGVYAFERRPFSPNALMDAALKTQELKLLEVRVESRLAADLPPVAVDWDAMLLALQNLLDNACKYTGAEKRIAVETALAGGCVVLSVQDNGVGIATGEQARIFQRFYQVDHTLARRAEGCGLGLSIVKQIVDAHGGRVAVESSPGSGSRFSIHLPLTA